MHLKILKNGGYSQKHILEHGSLYINSKSREFLIHITISRMEEIMKLLEIEEETSILS